MTLKNLRNHFLSMSELFWDAHIQKEKKASSWRVQCQAALAMWLPLNTSQPKAVALAEDTGAARAAKRAGTCPENRESKGLRTTGSCWKPKQHQKGTWALLLQSFLPRNWSKIRFFLTSSCRWNTGFFYLFIFFLKNIFWEMTLDPQNT